MKTILVATDFSKVSKNAIDYAAELAKRSKANLILFHAYYVPIVTTDVMVIPPIDEIEKGAKAAMKRMETAIQKKHGKKLNIQSVCKYGFAVDEINTYVKKNKIDLIVMGMHGGGYLTEKIIGSVTTSLIRKSKCAVLAIDKKVKFKPAKKIVLASDFLSLPDAKILKPLKEIAALFKSKIHVVNVVPPSENTPTLKKAVAGIKLEHVLEDINHDFYFVKNEDVVKGLNNYVKTKKMDMLVTFPRKHSLLKIIFNEPNTKQIAFHSKVPLLAIHE